MPEIGGEERQPRVDIHSGLMPVQQRAHSECMSEVVCAHVTALAAPFKTRLAAELRERVVEHRVGEPTPRPGDEERPAAVPVAVAQPGVVFQRPDGGGVQRDLALLRLPGAHVQRPALQVDVCAVQAERLPEPQPGRGHQPDHRLECRRAQRRRERSRGRHQRPDLRRRVDVRGDPRAMSGQQVDGRHLARGIERGQVAREAAHDPQPLAPPVRVCVLWQPGPHHRQIDRDPLRARLLEKLDEPLEQPPVGLELEPKLAADLKVVSQRLLKRGHAAPLPPTAWRAARAPCGRPSRRSWSSAHRGGATPRRPAPAMHPP